MLCKVSFSKLLGCFKVIKLMVVFLQVLLPIIGSLLDNAAHGRDILKLKTCLFAICTSLVVRGGDSALHHDMVKIRKILERVLLWPSADSDEVSKVQHGCIDCLAVMICAELQAPGSSKDLTQNEVRVVGEQMNCPSIGAVMSSVLTYVMQRLICDKNAITLTDSDENACHRESQSGEKTPDSVLMKSESLIEPSIPLSFRLCMANVLISACQKISSSGKHAFARRALPELIRTVEVVADSLIF
ncbi:uncharacterized protein LOC131255324 [Magnolia sinica]|uniref:uncharacterized protein LOC131255324 n=1 Tax=Magnolia sinica TaxID=86752 RepID=UPI0026580D4B|nr:uncharacterized protein LOC131255324 [Magnolia sinica]